MPYGQKIVPTASCSPAYNSDLRLEWSAIINARSIDWYAEGLQLKAARRR
jgi:hypothetical protein